MSSNFRRALVRTLDPLIPADARLFVRTLPHQLRQRASLWHQRALRIEDLSLVTFRAGFVGHRDHLRAVTDLLRLGNPATQPLSFETARDPQTALFCDWPLPGAMRVPVLLRTCVSLSSTLETTIAGFEPELKRRLRRLSERCDVRQVTTAQEAVRIHRELMVPFARARHEDRAELVAEAELVRLAREEYLALVSLDGRAVAAQSGHGYLREGKRCWEALRFGYPEEVFSDPHRMSDANALNAHCALRHAIDTGHQLFDFGTSPASPEGGLLQFKRRRGGFLSSFGCPPALWLRSPRQRPDAFFWTWPLFSLEKDGLVLNLGVPFGIDDDEVAARLKSVAYAGLEAVRLHAGRAVSRALEATAHEIFSSPGEAIHKKGRARSIELVRVPSGPQSISTNTDGAFCASNFTSV
jgi:hypothetical protein